jgi:GT2 family glycosyltransferase
MMAAMNQACADVRASAVRNRASVTAIVVTRGPTDYLDRTLAALGDQTSPPGRVLLVDAAVDGNSASHPALAELAERLPVPVTVLPAPGVRTFGGAVRAALAAFPEEPSGWLWLLHDDSAPEPAALAELLRAVERAPSVAVAGAKQCTWADPVRLLEVGFTTSRFGRRMTGIDEPEVDQGQHDAREDVLAVGVAGALVRRDVWEDLGGTDPSLGPFGDGLDLSRRARLAGHRVVVVPSAVVRHAQASMTGGRSDRDAARSTQARREAFLHGQLVAAPLPVLPAIVVLAVLSSLGRALSRFLTKEPNLVVAELAAPWRVLARPGQVARARRRASATRVAPRRTLRPLEATWRDVVGRVRDRRLSAMEERRRRRAPSELEASEHAAVRRRRRGVLLAVVVVAAAADVVLLGTWLPRLVSGARLTGGSLAFGDAGPDELWSTATSWWSTGGHGEAAAPEPFGLVMLPLTAVVGSLGRAVGLLVVTSVALAAVGAWYAAGAATRSLALRAWAAGVWAGAPALLIPLAQVRVGAVVAHVVLPWFVLGLARGVGAARTDLVESGLVGAVRLTPRPDGPGDQPTGGVAAAAEGAGVVGTVPAPESDPGEAGAAEPAAVSTTEPAEDPPGTGPEVQRATVRTWTVAEPSLAAAAAAALAFAVLTAAAPVLLPAGLLVLLAVAPAARRGGRLLWMPVPALVLHAPTILVALTTAGGWPALLGEPGSPVAENPAPAWQQALGWPVSPDALTGPWPDGVAKVLPLVAAGVVLVVAVPALLLRPPAGRAARAGWLVVVIGLAAALASTRVVSAVADTADSSTTTVASAAPGISLALAGALAAALLGAGELRDALARSSFGWRQLLAGILVLVAVGGPATVLGTALDRRHEVDLVATDDPVVPAVGRQMQQSAGLRVLLLEPSGDGVVATLLRQDGRQMTETSRLAAAVRASEAGEEPAVVGDAATATGARTDLEGLAAGLFAGATTDVSAELDALGIGAVLVGPGDDARRADLAGRLDATPGLERVTATEAGTIWRSAGLATGTAGWARVVDGTADLEGAVLGTLLATARAELDITLAPGDAQRLLVLAEASDPGWHARLDGRPLRAVESGWRQAFELGADGGHLVVAHESASRLPWLVLLGAVTLVTVLLAIPVRRRRTS